MENIESLKKQLERVEKQLDKCRTSTMQDGWQTQRFAKKSRRWDFYPQEKMRLIGLIEDAEKQDYEDKSREIMYCGSCLSLTEEGCCCENKYAN